MPRYRFSWTNLPAEMLADLADYLQLDGDPAGDLRAVYGARPRADFVRDAWPVLLASWFATDRAKARLAAARLRERGVGDLGERDDLAYLSGLRNTSGLRQVIIDLFIEFGEQTSDDRSMVMTVSTVATPFPPPTIAPGGDDLDDEELDDDTDEVDGLDDLDDESDEADAATAHAGTLHEFVAAALVEIMDGGVFMDADGDFVVPSGSAVAYVQVLNEPEAVRVFSLMVVDVAPSPKVLELINSINTKILIGRLVYVNGAIVLEHHLLPMGLSVAELGVTVNSIVSTADYFDHRLQSEVGGRIALPDPAEDEIDV